MSHADSRRSISVTLDRIQPLLAEAAAAGVDIAALLRSLDLDPRLVSGASGGEISLGDYYRIQNRLAILFGDETLHMSARQLLPGSTDFVLQHAGECKTLLEVMQVIARSYNLLHGGEYNRVELKNTSVAYIIDDRTFPYMAALSSDDRYFSIECILIFLHCMLMTVAPDAAAQIVKSVHVRRPKGREQHGQLAYWSAPVKFGANTYRLEFDKTAATMAIAAPAPESLTANAVYQRIVDAVANARGERGAYLAAKSLVRDALTRGIVEQKAVAAQMGVSVATLRRRLDEENTSFRDLRREVLNDTAKRLLRSERSIADVSEALGFSEFRSFNRAFKDWNGLTPKAYLRQSARRGP